MSEPQTSLHLLGKTAIVTGASRGLGAGMALRLARDGANVSLLRRFFDVPMEHHSNHENQVILGYTSESSASKVAKLKEQIEALPHSPTAHGVRANLAEPEGPKTLVDEALQWSSNAKIDILVNNAGVEAVKSLAELTIADYDRVYNTNVRGTLLVTQAVLPHLPAKARIINITSVGARSGFKDLSLYISSKAAVEGLTRAWAAELGGNGTTVNAVAPGPVQSDMLDNIPAEIKELQKKTTPVEGRFGTVEEVADIVAWLAGPASAWVSGQCINASGGWQMI